MQLCATILSYFNHTHWRAIVASETLTGVTQSKIGDVYYFFFFICTTYRGTNEKIGDVCLFIYLYIMFGRMYVILYFDPRVFVLVMWSTPSQILLTSTESSGLSISTGITLEIELLPF